MGDARDSKPSLLAAALALPGLAATLAGSIARAEEPPDHASIDLK